MVKDSRPTHRNHPLITARYKRQPPDTDIYIWLFPSRLKSAFRPIVKVARIVYAYRDRRTALHWGSRRTPHVRPPEPTFSFAALSRAAQEADAEENNCAPGHP